MMRRILIILIFPSFLFSQIYFNMGLHQKMLGGGLIAVVDSTGIIGINLLFHSDKRPSISNILAPVDEPYWWWVPTKRYRTYYSVNIITGHFFNEFFVFSEMGLTFGDEIIEYKSSISGLYFYLPSDDGPAQWDIDKFSWGLGAGYKFSNFLCGICYNNLGRIGAFVSVVIPYKNRKI